MNRQRVTVYRFDEPIQEVVRQVQPGSHPLLQVL